MSELTGRAILVAEDEYYAATDIRRELSRMGVRVVGPAPTLEQTIDLIESGPQIDGAILDINLGGEMIFPAADMLQERGVPFLFATGYDQSVIPARFGDVLRCEKPIGADRLAHAMTSVL